MTRCWKNKDGYQQMYCTVYYGSGHQNLGAWQSGTSRRACKRSSTMALERQLRGARGDQTVASRVGQTAARGPGSCVLCRGCCKLLLSGGRGGPLSPRRLPLRTVRERRVACNGNADDEQERFRTRMRTPPSNALAKRSALQRPWPANLYCTGY